MKFNKLIKFHEFYFFNNFFDHHTNLKFDQPVKYVIITTDNDGKIQMLVNAYEAAGK